MAIDYRVFPTAGRNDSSGEFDAGTNLVTEYNISNLINQLTDRPGFVKTKAYNSNGEFEFNIHGYYFKINQASAMIPGIPGQTEKSGEYVKFTYDSATNTLDAEIRIAQGDPTSYSYIIPTANQNWSDGTRYTLTILENVATAPRIPITSRIHFNTNIDDGDLDNLNN